MISLLTINSGILFSVPHASSISLSQTKILGQTSHRPGPVLSCSESGIELSGGFIDTMTL